MNNFSDYLIFVDESGDAGLTNIDQDYPILALVFTVIHKNEYIHRLVPEITALKVKYWGHDEIVFHEHDIRKEKGDFAFLRTNRNLRHNFIDDLSGIIAKLEFTIISTIIDKNAFLKLSTNSKLSVYDFAQSLCFNKLSDYLNDKHQAGKLVQIIFESRGKSEDSDLELKFNNNLEFNLKLRQTPNQMDFRVKFADKRTNSAGLQLADLIARPIGIEYLRPQQNNRAMDIIKRKNHIQQTFPNKQKGVGESPTP